jgi:hypothetical protein
MNTFLLYLITILTTIALPVSLSAQNAGLPAKGNWGVSLDIAPFIKQVDNFNKQNSPLFTPRIVNSPNAISVKYFLKDDLALRTKLRLGHTSTTINSLVPASVNTNPIDINYLEESVKVNQFNVGIIGGIEKRKSAGRVQGIFGGEAGILFADGVKFNYTYANPINIDVQSPETTDFSSQLGVNNIMSSSRILSNNQGYTFTFLARAIIGAEYFITQNLSLGFEYAWGLDLSSSKDALVTEEYWDATNASVVRKETIYKGRTSFGIDNHQLMIGVSVYF